MRVARNARFPRVRASGIAPSVSSVRLRRSTRRVDPGGDSWTQLHVHWMAMLLQTQMSLALRRFSTRVGSSSSSSDAARASRRSAAFNARARVCVYIPLKSENDLERGNVHFESILYA